VVENITVSSTGLLDGGVASPATGDAARHEPAPPTFELTIVMPCLNEAETLEICIRKARQFLAESGVSGEVIVADNGSTDGSQDIAVAAGARVVDVQERGYGAALIAGIRAADSLYVAMGDSDDSYDFTGLMPFVEQLRDGADLVMGNRFRGGIAPGAMPPLHRYLGNPVLSTVGRVFTGAPIKDFHCGLRAFRRDAILALNLQTPGMEFASEMVVRARYNGLRITEVPTTLSPDGRSRPPHLRSWRDGWRHLRFLLTFAPNWLFLYPGLALFGLGSLGVILLIGSDLIVGQIGLGIHTLLFATSAVLIGTQLTSFWYISRLFGIREGYWPSSERFDRLRRILTVDRMTLFGGAMLVVGILFAVIAFAGWAQGSFGPLDGTTGTTRLVIGSVMLSAFGVQVIMTGFLAGLMTDRG
jgi:glycosyltransferase involved in cell wall biosynthesis